MKSVLVGIGGAFLGLAGAAVIPVVVAILGAVGGATMIVGVGVWRALRGRRDRRVAPPASSAPWPPPAADGPGTQSR